MSEPTSSNLSATLSSILSFITLVAAPALMVIMLAYVGIRLLGESRLEPVVEVAQTDPIETEVPAIPDPAKVPDETSEGESSVDLAALGKTVYSTSCAACHGPDAKGIKAGPMLMAPSLIGSDLLLHEDPDVPNLVLLKGIQKQGAEYLGVMAALGAALDDEKIAAVLTYLRSDYGNDAPPITVAEVTETREKFAELAMPAGVPRDEVIPVGTEK